MVEDTESILTDARSLLKTAKHGLELIKSQNPNYLPIGVRNVLTFGREVTRILQRLRSHESEFDEWYSVNVEKMENDPLLKYLYRLRNDVLKEGKMPVSSAVYVKYFDMTMLAQIPKPPNASGFFIGDKYGGSGWHIKLPDGTTEKFYINLPWDIVEASVHFRDMPEKHLGKNIRGMSIEQVCELYIEYLERMINDATNRFL